MIIEKIPYSVITKVIEEEALGGESPWFQSKEDFEKWSGDVLDCIIFKILYTLGIEADAEK